MVAAATKSIIGKRTSLILADDHAGVREEIHRLLVLTLDVVRTVDCGVSLVQAVAELRPDVVVTDIRMPNLDGIQAARQVLEAGWCKTIVILSTCDEVEMLRQALAAGVLGYVLKVDASNELVPAIKAALGGQVYVSNAFSRKKIR